MPLSRKKLVPINRSKFKRIKISDFLDVVPYPLGAGPHHPIDMIVKRPKIRLFLTLRRPFL